MFNIKYVWKKLNFIRFERIYKNLCFYLIRYPCYKSTKINKAIKDYNLSKDEADELLKVSDKGRLGHMLYVASIICLIILYGGHGFYVLLIELDHERPENNLILVGDNLVKFNCMITNCTRLSNNSASTLADDFLMVSQLSICHPMLMHFTLPTIDMGKNGQFLYSLTGLGLLNYCFIPILVQMFWPIGDETMIFAAAPEYSRRHYSSKIKTILVGVMLSLVNFRKDLIKLNIESKSLKIYEQDKLAKLSQEFDDRRELKLLLMAKYRDQNIKYDFKELDNYVNDCMPIIRSNWWHRHIKTYCMVTMMVVPFNFVVLLISNFSVLYLWILQQEQLMNEYGTFVKWSGCAVWLDDGSYNTQTGSELKIVHLDQVDLFISVLGTLQFILVGLTPFAILIISICSFMNSMIDLLSWTSELSLEMDLSIELLRLKMLLDRDGSGSVQETKPIKFELHRIQALIIELNHDLPFFWFISNDLNKGSLYKPTSSSILNNKIYHQRLAIDWLSEQLKTNNGNTSVIEMLEKTYIKFRLLYGTKDNYAHSITCLIIYNNIISYICGFTVLILTKDIENFLLPFGFAFICLVWNNVVILAAAQFKTTVSNQALELWVNVIPNLQL